jgi:hypothetical protein
MAMIQIRQVDILRAARVLYECGLDLQSRGGFVNAARAYNAAAVLWERLGNENEVNECDRALEQVEQMIEQNESERANGE